MPILTDPVSSAPAPQVRVEGSVAVELEWVLGSSQRRDFQDDHPVLGSVYAERSDLIRRIAGFWGEDEAVTCNGFIELVLLAHHGGVLFSMEPRDLLDPLEDLCVELPGDVHNLPLRSETPEDRRSIIRRVQKLRRSASRRREFAELMRDAWAPFDEPWREVGRTSVEAAVAERRAQHERGASWIEVARSECDYGDMLTTAVEEMGPGGTVAVVPAFYAHRGLLIDAPGLVVVGVNSDITGAQARARTEALAHRLRAISDPTRLAILDAIRTAPRTITEIASAFGLAQPTVSNHVKLLRDAGFVTETRDGTRRRLSVAEPELGDLVRNLQDVLRVGLGA